MKKISVIRKFDNLGRIGIPKWIRDKFGIIEKTPMKIYAEGNKIIIENYKDTCVFCNSENNLKRIKEKMICDKCLQNIIQVKQ